MPTSKFNISGLVPAIIAHRFRPFLLFYLFFLLINISYALDRMTDKNRIRVVHKKSYALIILVAPKQIIFQFGI